MNETKPFRISSGLKDLIGRDLITDDFVAIFELVKNSFDAHARNVALSFDANQIVISDDGKGMSLEDMFDKWLFVAYSAKRAGTEDDNYRDVIEQRKRPFAGAKGVGRFSCDRLGTALSLYSRTHESGVHRIRVNWLDFEIDAKKEFAEVMVEVGDASDFLYREDSLGAFGTTLVITNLRSFWDRDKLVALRRELSKLIDPFAGDESPFQITIEAPEESFADLENASFNEARTEGQSLKPIVNGPIKNKILEVLSSRTTFIKASLSKDGKFIETTLEDRGETVYQIREINPYKNLDGTEVNADIYFLNRSAKQIFALRMGLPSVQFGSVFLFRNGFRVFPVGAEDDDFFGLSRRKQQGQRRFLGTRDLIGRVDLKGVSGFDEATSRNQGLIRTENVDALIEFVRDKCVKRLERYVVDITWKDTFDKDVGDMSRMKLDTNSALISNLVSRLAATDGIDLIYYNPNLVRIVDEKSEQFEGSLRALELLGEKTGNQELLVHIQQAKTRLRNLEAAEEVARQAERRAEERASVAERVAAEATGQLKDERERNSFLVAAGTLDQDTILNLHHQIIIHAADVHNDIQLMMSTLRSGKSPTSEEWIDMLERVAYRNSQILTAARFATKGGYKQQASQIKDDLALYVRDYVENVASLWSKQGMSISTTWDGNSAIRTFKPIEVGIVIDNLVKNAEKAGASEVTFSISKLKPQSSHLQIDIADNGRGWHKTMRPISRIFEKGVTSTSSGSGLGLFHVKQIVEGMKGTIEANEYPYSDEMDGAHLIIRFPA